MSINLQKGQKIDLTKSNPGLTQLMVGLGWDPAEQSRKGKLLGRFFGGNVPNIDCDASVFMLDVNGKLANENNLVCFYNLKSPCGSVKHMGDNLTGAGDGDDEQIFVDLNRVPVNVHRLTFVVNIYECVNRNQDFSMIKNAFIRVLNPSNNQELIKYNLSEGYTGKTTLIAGEVYRHNGEWKFSAVGESTTDPSLSALKARYS